MKLPHLAVAITFFYNDERFGYLRQIASHYADMSDALDVYLVTNADDFERQEKIRNALGLESVQFVVPKWLGHPFY